MQSTAAAAAAAAPRLLMKKFLSCFLTSCAVVLWPKTKAFCQNIFPDEKWLSHSIARHLDSQPAHASIGFSSVN
jgi:hypothetical protein